MTLSELTSHVLDHQARSLLCRLDHLQPLSLSMPMVAAASITPQTQRALARYLGARREAVRRRALVFLAWLERDAAAATPADARRRMSSLKLQLDALLAQLDIFADALTQRGEHNHGVWLAGLDVLAEDALDLLSPAAPRSPLMTYLQAGRGARIRRRGTRMPGGGRCPISLIEIPRERMLGVSVAVSLCHEVGHLAIATLGLLEPLKAELCTVEFGPAGSHWRRWISESMADLHALATLGPAATLGLIDVLMLPRALAHRLDPRGVHPSPWIRVQLSCVFGRALYPHPQWDELRRLWTTLYPTSEALEHEPGFRPLLESMPRFVRAILAHRPACFEGRTVAETLHHPDRDPKALRARSERWLAEPQLLPTTRPSVAFATLGHAKHDGRLSTHAEAELLRKLLRSWAQRRALSPR